MSEWSLTIRWVLSSVGATAAADRSRRSCCANMCVMTLLVLLLVSVAAATDGDGALYKCCDPDSSFRQNMITGDLTCDLAVSPLQVHGASVRYGFPDSCNKSVIMLKQNHLVPTSRYCIDKVEMGDGSVQSASLLGYVCDDDDSVRNLTSPTVIKIKKCCVNGTYDPESHICRENIDGQEILQSVILRDTACLVNVDYGLSKCDPTEAVVSVVVTNDNTELLTNGTLVVNTINGRLTLKDDTFCVDGVVNSSDSVVVKFCQSVSTACTEGPCVQKCCPDGYGLIESKNCSSSGFDFNPQFYKTVATDNGFEHVKTTAPSFAILSDLKCERYILQPELTEQDVSYLEADGRLYAPKQFDHRLTKDRYCLEKVFLPEDDMDGIYTFLCFQDGDIPDEPPIRYILCALGLITSSLFLLATFLVYACLPTLQNLHGKTLMCHVVSLFAAYVCLSVAQLGGTHLDQPFCVALGYCILLTFLAAFSWLNVMCFDIWWTFGVIRSVSHGAFSRKQRERHRFALYSIYAWGLPSALTAITAIMDVFRLSPATLKPDMGVYSCWFSKETYGIVLHFFGPVSPMVTCNVVLFLLTARSCSKVKAEIHRMQQNSIGDRCKKRYQADKSKLIMNAKLFVVMGVTWTLEIVSAFVTELRWIWYLVDTANALQGALIFCIFVLKRKVMRKLAHRLGLPNLRPIIRPNTTGNPTTCYDPYHERKASSTSTLNTTITDCKNDRRQSGPCK